MNDTKLHVTYTLPVFVKKHLTDLAKDRSSSYTAVVVEAVERFLGSRGLDEATLRQRPQRKIGTYTKGKLLIHEFLLNNNQHVEPDLWETRLSHFQLPVSVIEAVTDTALYLGVSKTAMLSLALLEMSLCEARQQKAA